MISMDRMMSLAEFREVFRSPGVCKVNLVDAATIDGDDYVEAGVRRDRDSGDYEVYFRDDIDRRVWLRAIDYGRGWCAYRYDAPLRPYLDAECIESGFDDLYFGFVGFRLVFGGVSWLGFRVVTELYLW